MSQVRTLARLELVGNALCLDFANTVNSRQTTVHDYLGSYADLLDWSEHAGALGPDATRRLRAQGADRRAAATLADAHRLRDTIHAVFSAIARGRQPNADRIAQISAGYATAIQCATIERRTSIESRYVYALGWPAPHRGQLDAPLWPVAYAAGELLLSGDLKRIGECPGCGWLFLDISRNGTRRWCSMDTCGSRDKMSRYQRRRRQAARLTDRGPGAHRMSALSSP